MACDDALTNQDIADISANVKAVSDWAEGGPAYTATMANGRQVPSPSKLIADAKLFKPPIPWTATTLVTDATQAYIDNDIVYAPIRSLLPFTTGATFTPSNWYVIQGGGRELVPLDDLKTDGSIAVGDFIESSEYVTGSGVGDGKYQKVSVDPGNNLINPATSDGNWLKLVHNGVIDISQAGAQGDGDLTLTGLPVFTGTDDTAAIQECNQTLIDGYANKVTAGSGVFNFTDIKFYDAASLAGLRGNFEFEGVGRCNPVRLSAGTLDYGTVFKCTSTTGSFDINTAALTGGGTALNFNSSMSAIKMSSFSVIGSTTGNLVSADLVVGHSDIGNITILNKDVAGHALYTRSNFTSYFHGIQIYGGSGNRLGVGWYYDTDLGAGQMGTFSSITSSSFEDGNYFGHTSLAATTHGGISNSLLTSIQGQDCVNNFHLGKLTTDISVDGNQRVYFNNLFAELPDANDILLEYDASISVTNGTFNGVGDPSAASIRIANEQATDLRMAGTITINESQISVKPTQEAFCVIPVDSRYSVFTSRNTGRTFDEQVFKMPTTYLGVMILQDDEIEGYLFTSERLTDGKQYLHPDSRIRGHRPLRAIGPVTYDMSDRAYISDIDVSSAGGDVIITLPDNPEIMYNSVLSTAYKSASGNFTVNSSAVNIRVNGGAKVNTFTATATGYFYEIKQFAFNNTSGFEFEVSTNDPAFP